jgi:hypothetical protein
MSAIDDKYAELGGPGGWLGRPVDSGGGSDEMTTADGRGRTRISRTVRSTGLPRRARTKSTATSD